MLRAARSLAAFLDAPFDRSVTLPSLFAWQQGTARGGVCVFGALDRAAVCTLFRVLEMDAHPSALEHVSIADFRDVTYTDLSAMGLFLEMLRERMPRFARKVTKRLVLLPVGQVGILLGGLRFQLPSPYDIRLGTDLAPHLPWLGIDCGDPLLPWLDRQRSVASGETDLTRALRGAFEGGARTIGDCAKSLAYSERTLQRSLAASGTTFRDIRRRHALNKARLLLASSAMPLAEIAAACGFSTQQHFTTAFRTAFGNTPARFRAQSAIACALPAVRSA
jgi:AraC-like DNA-binding protein